VTDRVVQAALKLVLEPILEADFQPCSYGFRPGRRAQDAIAEIHHLISRPAGYGWVVEGDITACFDEIDHPALLQRVRRRITDKRVLALIKAFCKGGILTQDGATQDTITGTPKEASSPRCWPTSPSASWTSTSPRPGRASARPGPERSFPRSREQSSPRHIPHPSPFAAWPQPACTRSAAPPAARVTTEVGGTVVKSRPWTVGERLWNSWRPATEIHPSRSFSLAPVAVEAESESGASQPASARPSRPWLPGCQPHPV
jgi:hypothetical protein